jgi:hypothetical protein
MLINTLEAPPIETLSSNGFDIARSAAIIDLFSSSSQSA